MNFMNKLKMLAITLALTLLFTGCVDEEHASVTWWEYAPYYPGLEEDDKWRELKADTHELMDDYQIGVYIIGSIYGPNEENSKGEIMFTNEDFARQCYEYECNSVSKTAEDARLNYENYVALAVTSRFEYTEIAVGGVMEEVLTKDLRNEIASSVQAELLENGEDADRCMAIYQNYLEALKPWLEQAANLTAEETVQETTEKSTEEWTQETAEKSTEEWAQETTETAIESTPSMEDTRDFAYLYDDLLLYYCALFENNDPYLEYWKETETAMSLREIAGFVGTEGLDAVGYVLEDISGDEVPELILGALDMTPGTIYAVYTLEGDLPKLVVDGHARNAFYRGEGNRLLNVGSSGAIYHLFGSYSLTENGLNLVCEDFYYTHEINNNFENIGCFHNTSGEMTGASSEQMDLSLDAFWELERDFLSAACKMELTPLREYYGVGDPSYYDSTWLEVFRSEEIRNDYGEWDEVRLTDDPYSVDIAFLGGHIEDLTLFKIVYTDEGVKTEDTYVYGTMKEDYPLMVRLTFYGDMPSWGVAFTDMEGTYHQLAIELSGEDGGLMLSELYRDDSTEDSSNQALSELREVMEQNGYGVAVAYLGNFDMDVVYLEEFLTYSGTYEAFPFVKDISKEDFIDCPGEEVYLVVPLDPMADVSVHTWYVDERNNFQGGIDPKEPSLYSGGGAPFLLKCNLYDSSPETVIQLSQENGYMEYMPSRVHMDGTLNYPGVFEWGFGVMDITRYD